MDDQRINSSGSWTCKLAKALEKTLDQETYIESVIEKFGMQDSNPSETLA